MSEWKLYTQLFAGTEDAEDLREVCPQGAQRRSERKTLPWQQGDGRADQFRSRSSWCSGDLRRKLDLLLWPRDQKTEFPVEACWLSQTQKGQTEQIHPQTFDDPFFWQHWHDLHVLGSHWTDSQQGIRCWGFRGVQKEIPLEEASTLQIGSVAFPPGQCTSPQLHSCHRLFNQDEKQNSSSTSLQSRPCSLWLLLIPLAQRLSLWDNWGDERGCDDCHWHADTRGLPWGLPEVVGTL